ncbi:hypothetical protein DTO271G3_5725 [Paecilomyces variotii]|nr:hypothetical protein DTO271G3_5725 [Paecilomyces variotii]
MDTRPPSAIGASGLYSPQNGLLLSVDIHEAVDNWEIGVDPDEGYKIVDFSNDELMIGGRSLALSAFNSPNPNDRVSPDLLRRHLRMCLLQKMKERQSDTSSFQTPTTITVRTIITGIQAGTKAGCFVYNGERNDAEVAWPKFLSKLSDKQYIDTF